MGQDGTAGTTWYTRSAWFSRSRSGICCAPGMNRTSDARFRKPTLYPLSYGGEADLTIRFDGSGYRPVRSRRRK